MPTAEALLVQGEEEEEGAEQQRQLGVMVIGSHIPRYTILISEQNLTNCSDEEGTVRTA